METHTALPVIDVESIQIQLSFRPFVNYLKARHRQTSYGGLDQFYALLIDQFEAAALMTEQPPERRSATRLAGYFQLATVVVMPLMGNDQSIPYAFGLPAPMRLYHTSAAFDALTRQFPDFLTQVSTDQDNSDVRTRFLYGMVLEKCYDLCVPNQHGPSVRFAKTLNGLTRYYQIDINVSFVEPHFSSPMPPLEPAWADFVRYGTPIPDGVPPLPLDKISFEGFSFFKIDDVTEAESIRQLREVFINLTSTADSILYQQVETALRNLCGQPGLEVGVMALPRLNGEYVFLPDNHQHNILLRLSGIRLDEGITPEVRQILSDLTRHPQPQVLTDFDAIPAPARAALARKNIRSVLVYPITDDGKNLLGLLEMGSPLPNAFDEPFLTSLDRILPIIREFIRHQLQEFTNQLEQLIKTRYTPLQPAVEWKFYEAATDELRRQQLGIVGEAVPVAFPQVYPFYGAVDIRDSSVERQKAIRQDLSDQLTRLDSLLNLSQESVESIDHRHLRLAVAGWQTRLRADLTPDDERAVGLFLTQEANPYLHQLAGNQYAVANPVANYFTQTDPQTGQFRQGLTAFEQSINRLNELTNQYIDQQQQQLQAIFPHYAERYRTDGTEYTLYVGQSIAPNQLFGPDINRQLCQWQLNAMIEIAWLAHRLGPQLPLPLQTTQLILAHSQPVDICFRHDERRFDVEGSYSIRYEVLKKRIDKVLILGTEERLTQPDTLVIVYSEATEIAEYLPFIARLQAEGKLTPGTEQLDLEPLKGVHHLRALRVNINYPATTVLPTP